MKRKELLAKSLAVGLAVAMAASSMSAPGGLLAPVEVMAEVTGETELTEANIREYFTITTAPVVLSDGGSVDEGAVFTRTEKGTEDATGTVTILWKNGDGEPSDSAPSDAGTYTILLKVAGGTDLAAKTDAGVTLGTVKAVKALTGTVSLGGSMVVGETITASGVEKPADGADLTYTFYRVKAAEGGGAPTEEVAQAASATATYTLAAADIGATIKVVVSAGENYSTLEKTAETAVDKKTCTETLTTDVFGDLAADKTSLGIKNDKNLGLEYSVDKGDNWSSLSGTSIPLENKTYAAETIQVRVAETTDTKASNIVKYATQIKASLTGEVKITGTAKYGETLTAAVTGAQDGATLKYQFIRVKDSNTENISGATSSTYTLAEDDIGATIKVKVTADDYDGELVSAETAAVTPADARPVAAPSIASKVQNDTTYTYTLATLTGTGAKYACVEGSYSSFDSLPEDATVSWQDTAVFAGLEPGTQRTFLVTYDQDDACYAKSEVKCLPVTVDKLKRAALSLNVTVADEGGGKKVTITEVTGAEYSFDGGTTYGSDKEKTFTADEVSANPNITVAIRYPDDAKYETVAPLTQALDLSKLTQTAPSAATVTFTTNAGKTKYKPRITEDDATLEYSTNGQTYDKTKADIEAMELDADTAFNLYVRKAATETENASSGVCTSQTTPAASAVPTITGDESFEDSTTVTLSGSGTIYYTTDGSAPSLESDTYSAPLTIEATTTVRAIAVENTKIMSAEASKTFTKGTSGGGNTGDNTGGSGSGSGSSGGSSSGSTGGSSSGTSAPSTETKSDGTTVTTTEEKKPDGTTVTTTEEKKPDGSTATTTEEKKPDGTTVTTTKEQNKDGSTKTAVEEKKADGSATTTTQEKKADGTTLSGVEEKKADGSSAAEISLENKDTGVQATVNVAKDTSGKVTDAKASVTQTVPDKTARISAAVASQIAESAGTKEVIVTEKVVGTNGKTVCKVTVNLSDLSAGNDMKVLKINKKTGELSLINKSTYTVDADGSIALSDLKTANYMLVTAEEAETFSNEVKASVKVEKSKKSVTAGKKTKITLNDELNMDNVAKITYASSKKSVATVSKNGKITTKKAGKVTIKAKVTLKNGETKTVKMTVTVKAKKQK